MFSKMPFILLAIIAAVLLLSPFMSLEVKQAMYAMSLSIQSFILFLLPLIIFSLLYKTMVSMAQRATLIIVLILLCVCLSNSLSTFLSHYVGAWIYHFNLSIILPNDNQGLTPAWSWQLPQIIANDKAMFLGIILGIIMGRVSAMRANWLSEKLDVVVVVSLKLFTYLIPFFIAGYMVKLQYEGVIHTILNDYAVIFALIALAQFTYILFACAILNRFNRHDFICHVKNILPAAIAGFTTMSSAAVMPLTITGVENNARNKVLAKSVVPATVNIHLIGDCFAIPIFAYAVMKSYGFAEPALMSYLMFMFYFVIAKFSVAAVPGGGIIVMLPILQACLGFNAEMLALMTALYILFDPVITGANVLGNGVFAALIDKLVSALQRLSPVKSA